MFGVVFTGGLGPERRWAETVLKKADLQIAADSGLLLAEKLGVYPDLIVGDMDSLPDAKKLEDYGDAEIIVFPREKDDTDTEIALRILYDRGCTETAVLGGGGGRLDHLLGIVSLFYRDRPPLLWLTDAEEVTLIGAEKKLVGLKNQTVTFFPATKERTRMKSTGLKWPLDALVWEPGDIGLSNVVTDDIAHVEVTEGRLLMIRSWRMIE